MTEQAAEIDAVQAETATDTASNDAVNETTTETSDEDSMGAVFDRLTTDEPETPSGERDRDDLGRFTAQDKPETDKDTASKPKEAEADKNAEDVTAGDEENADTEQKTADDASSAPAHLPYDIKSKWQEIPESARQAITALTTEQDRKFGELGREMANLKPVKDVVSEFNEYFDGTVASYKPEEAMRHLFGLQRQMDKDPVGTIMDIAKTYGVDGQLTQPTDGTREIAALNQTIRQLQTRLEKIGDGSNVENTVSKVLEQRDFNKALDDFSKDKPFYADVESLLVDNEESGRPGFISFAWDRLGNTAEPLKVLEYAYDMAINAIPEVREKAQAAKTEKDKAANAPDPKRTDAARRAASINVKSTASGKQGYASEEEAMGAAYDRMTA